MPADDVVNVEVITQVKKSIAGLAKLAVGIYAAKKAFDAIVKIGSEFIKVSKEAAYLKQINMAFESMATAAGKSSTAILDSMRELSGGTISAMEMIQSANRAMILGIPIDDLDKMMKIARASATATGSSVKQMFDDIVVGVGRQSRMILDNLGILVKVEEANKNYAEMVGIVGRELTDAEKRQAFLNEVLIAGEDIIKKVGKAGQETTSAERWQQMTAAIADLRVEMGMKLLPAFESITGALTNYARKMADAMKEARDLRDLMESITVGNIEEIDSVESLDKAFEGYETQLREINKTQKEYNKMVEGMVEAGFETQEGIDKVNKSYDDQKSAIYSAMDAVRAEIEVRKLELALAENVDFNRRREIESELELAKIKEATAKKTAEFLEWVNTEYEKTTQGTIEAKEAEINYAEAMLQRANKTKPQIQAIIELLKEELGLLKEEAAVAEGTINERIGLINDWKDAEDSRVAAAMGANLAANLQEKDAHEEKMGWISEEMEAWIEAAQVRLDATQGMFDAITESSNAYFDMRLQGIDNEIMAEEERLEKLQEIYNQDKEALKTKLDSGVIDYETYEEALKALDDELTAAQGNNMDALDKKRKDMLTKQAKADKAAAIIQAMINVLQGVTKALGAAPPPINLILAAITAAAGAVTVGMIAAKPIPSFATGGEFITSGPQPIMVGDNPSGRELINIEPLGVGGKGQGQIFHVTFVLGAEVMYDKFTKATKNGEMMVHIDSVGDF